jgi:acyl-CoA synthetase (AMP-forming)/AMP-acid ligase II
MTALTVDAGDDLDLTVPALLRSQAAARPDHAFLIADDDRLTFGEAERRSAQLARGLLAAGVGRGSRVALLHPNGSDLVVGWLAAARIGAVSVPLSTFSTSAELVGLLRGCDASVLLSASSYRSQDYPASLQAGIPELDLQGEPPLLSPRVPSLRRIAFTEPTPGVDPGWTAEALVAGGGAIGPGVLEAAEAAVAPADPMVIVHTSGSTSEPKGVVHTHGALIRHLDNLNQMRRLAGDEILFANSPFFWIGGFAYSLLGSLVAGTTLVCSNDASAAGVLDVIERERPTMVNGFAAAVAHLPKEPSFAGRDLSSIRRGNLYPIMPEAVRPQDPELHHGMLGMTEAGSVCLASEDEGEQPESRRGSFGQPVPGFEIRVRSEEDGADCAPGEVGELCFRGPFLMQGYDGRERHETFDADGWYRTGDLVHVDGDGFVYFKGRSSDMIKTAGANVSPREVEAAILEVSSLVAHVVGIDDDARGQLVAAIVRAPAGTAPADVDVDALRTQLKDRLSAYKVPKRMVALTSAEVPMMSSGKLDLRAIKELLGGA